MRDYQVKKIPQSDLVPGDVVVLTKGITYADMVAITANNVLVDESALTVSFSLRIYILLGKLLTRLFLG